MLASTASDLTEADVVLEITARSQSGRGIDQAALNCLREALERSYGALFPAGVRFEQIALLEEAPRRCSTVWLRVRPREGFGDALVPSLKYLAQATLAIIAWMDGTSNLQVADLQRVIRLLAWGASALSPRSPAAPSAVELVNAVAGWEQVKGALHNAESARIITQHGSTELDLSKTIADPRALLLQRKLINSATAMILVVDVPDYSGSGYWQFKHGEDAITLRREPGTLLDQFYTRELDIRPGDALHCQVETETLYGPDYEMLGQSLKLVKVIEVLRAGSSAETEWGLDDPDLRVGRVQELRPSSRIL